MLESMISKISDISILYVKMFQWFSYDFTDKMCDKKTIDTLFRNFLDKVKFSEEEIDREEITAMIEKCKAQNQELLVENTPINSGTIALAFKGTLDNKQVIIKLARKNIVNRIKNDINTIEVVNDILYFLDFIPFFNSIRQFTKFFIFNKDLLIKQTDFNQEIKNMQYFYTKFKQAKDIIVPNVYTEYSNEKVILMDFIDSVNIDTLEKEEYKIFFALFLKFFYNCVISKKIIHCDVHLGNILFVKRVNEMNQVEYKLCILDYGICLEIDVKEQNFLDEFLKQLLHDRDNYNNVFKNILNHMKDKYNLSVENFDLIIHDINQYVRTNTLLGGVSISHCDIYNFVKIVQKYDVIIPENIYKMLLCFVSLMGTSNKLSTIFSTSNEKQLFFRSIL
uniref:ABC1 atypical kinase-like domain-containing protein n=1 Tax=viral metagenome TaxID=1070528 RepID=A0A6C0BA01_9ZZZZ